MVDKPKAELRAFVKTTELQLGESQLLTFSLSARDLAFFVDNKVPGFRKKRTYPVKIGASSEDIELEKEFIPSSDII